MGCLIRPLLNLELGHQDTFDMLRSARRVVRVSGTMPDGGALCGAAALCLPCLAIGESANQPVILASH